MWNTEFSEASCSRRTGRHPSPQAFVFSNEPHEGTGGLGQSPDVRSSEVVSEERQQQSAPFRALTKVLTKRGSLFYVAWNVDATTADTDVVLEC